MTELELLNLFLMFANKYPKIALALTIISALRLVMKPLNSFLWWWVEQTPSKRDDRKLQKFLSNKYVKIVLYLVDWFGSIKIKAKGGSDAPN